MFQAIIICNFQENYRIKIKKKRKEQILGPILAYLAQIWILIFFMDFISSS